MSVPRVLLVCESLGVRGGVERFVCELGNALAARGFAVVLGNVDTARDGVPYALDERVRVAADPARAALGERAHVVPDAAGEAARRGSGPQAQEPSGGIRLWRLATARWRAARALARVVAGEPADVVVLNGVVIACSVLLVAPRVAARTICCDHNHFFARSRLWRRLRARLYPRVAAVVSLTEADRPRFAALNPNTVVIANASSLRAAAPAMPREPVVVAVGRHVAQKGFDLLLQAWARVVAAAPSARLRIVGDGPLEGELRALADALGVAGSVAFVAPTSAIEAEYRGAAVFVLSSRYEGMPLALLEAQALGVPAVAFDCPTGPAEILGTASAADGAGAPEGAEAASRTPGPGDDAGARGRALAPRGESGIVVPAGDVDALAAAIVALLAEPPRRARMAAAAIARSDERFSVERHLEDWTALVRQVAAAQQGRP